MMVELETVAEGLARESRWLLLLLIEFLVVRLEEESVTQNEGEAAHAEKTPHCVSMTAYGADERKRRRKS